MWRVRDLKRRKDKKKGGKEELRMRKSVQSNNGGNLCGFRQVSQSVSEGQAFTGSNQQILPTYPPQNESTSASRKEEG